MKKVVMIFLCVLIVLLMPACKRSRTGLDSATSSNVYENKTSGKTESQVNTPAAVYKDKTSDTSKSQASTSSTAIKNTTVSFLKNTTTSVGEGSQVTQSTHAEVNSWIEDNPYRDIVCAKTLNFQEVSVCVQDTNAMIHIMIPKEWSFEKNNNGYSIVKNSQEIGYVTTLGKTHPANESVNVFHGELTVGDIKITHNIDCVNYNTNPSYARTLCYSYDNKYGNDKNVVLTVPYQEIDTSAVVKMMTEVRKSVAFTEKNMGVLQIRDNLNKILILGNSFVNTSQVGNILQDMCGSNAFVEAYSRGYATVETYVQDSYMLQNIREGNYSVVFMCGFYRANDGVQFSEIVDACESSNTQLAIFPAHNETRSLIDEVTDMYPNVVLIDWKAEVDGLISTGIDVSNFCINDSHQHSTPLAGYVGAHMIYRAVFNKNPKTTSFDQVSKSQINLLGDYVTNGSVALFDESAAYLIE